MRNFQGQFANKGGRNSPKSGKVKNTKGTVKRIWNYMGYEKAALMFVIFLVFVTTLLGLLGPYFMGVIIDQYIVPERFKRYGKNVYVTYCNLRCNGAFNVVTNVCHD